MNPDFGGITRPFGSLHVRRAFGPRRGFRPCKLAKQIANVAVTVYTTDELPEVLAERGMPIERSECPHST